MSFYGEISALPSWNALPGWAAKPAQAADPPLPPVSVRECRRMCLMLHLESCTPGQDWAEWFVPVRTSTYQYMTVHDISRIPHLNNAGRTSAYFKKEV
jgi:hypothetical protein